MRDFSATITSRIRLVYSHQKLCNASSRHHSKRAVFLPSDVQKFFLCNVANLCTSHERHSTRDRIYECDVRELQWVVFRRMHYVSKIILKRTAIAIAMTPLNQITSRHQRRKHSRLSSVKSNLRRSQTGVINKSIKWWFHHYIHWLVIMATYWKSYSAAKIGQKKSQIQQKLKPIPKNQL